MLNLDILLSISRISHFLFSITIVSLSSFWYVNITSNNGFFELSIGTFNFFTNMSKGYGWLDKSFKICSFISSKNSLKVSSGFIFPLVTILFTNIPNISFVSSISLLAIGVPIVISVCSVYLFNNM